MPTFATALAPLAFALAGGGDGVSVTLEKVSAYAAQGHRAEVRLTFANETDAPASLPAAALFGGGLEITLVDDSVHRVEAAPEGGPERVPMAPRSRLAVVLDLALLSPPAFAELGIISVVYRHDDLVSNSFSWTVWKDYAGKRAVIHTDFGEIELELFFDRAPVTVKNFLDLADSGFYDGLTFHRIYKGFMIQGGCPKGDGTGNTANIPLEPGVEHVRGTISMARGSNPDSGSCQFFLVHEDSHFLDGGYAGFGRIVRGLDVMDRIAEVEVERDPSGDDEVATRPVEKVFIRKIRVLDAAPEADQRSPRRPGANR